MPILAKALLAFVGANLLFLPFATARHDELPFLPTYTCPSSLTRAFNSFDALKYGTSLAGT